MEISQLKTDRLTIPLGFDKPNPEFSWILKSKKRGTAQTAFEIGFVNSIEKLDSGNFWQS